MNNQQNNDFTMGKAVNAFFLAHNGKVVLNIPLSDTATALKNKLKEIDEALQKQGEPTTGYTTDKKNAKSAMVSAASPLGNAASVYFKNKGDQATADKLHNAPTHLIRLGGNKCKGTCQDIYKILNDNIGVLDPNYVTAIEVGDLLTKINAYDSNSDEQSDAKKETPVATKALKVFFKKVEGILEDADNLMSKYESTDPVFFTEYKETRKVPDYGLHHSGVDGVITNAVTGLPVQDVVIKDDQSNKVTQSDPDGNFNLDKLSAKQHSFTATHPNYQTFKFAFTIRRGKHVHFNFSLSPL